MEDEKKLRGGFTTGTCAAAAVKAAVSLLFTGKTPERITLRLPDGREVKFFLEEAVFPEGEGRGKPARCAVRKDAGDDPDVTNGVWIYGTVRRIPEGMRPEALTDKPLYGSDGHPSLFLTGGEGIGLVTKRGLPCPPGFYAINPVPRAMIFEAAAEACRGLDSGEAERLSGEEKRPSREEKRLSREPERLLIEISIPEGQALAEKTFNPNLGIRGGISVLGTSGIVNPMSEQALLETIRLDIRVKAQEGRRLLAVAPGNYGEDFLRSELHISMDAFVKCSNFIGETFRMMREEGIGSALFAGHVGKLIKVAGGVLNTHSKYGDRRMEIFCDCAKEAGVPEAEAEALLSMNTTEEAVEYLTARGRMTETASVITERIRRVIAEGCGIAPEVVVFSGRTGILGMTEGAASAAEQLNKNIHKGG